MFSIFLLAGSSEKKDKAVSDLWKAKTFSESIFVLSDSSIKLYRGSIPFMFFAPVVRPSVAIAMFDRPDVIDLDPRPSLSAGHFKYITVPMSFLKSP